jgi:hypothetical protein
VGGAAFDALVLSVGAVSGTADTPEGVVGGAGRGSTVLVTLGDVGAAVPGTGSRPASGLIASFIGPCGGEAGEDDLKSGQWVDSKRALR